jgi:hypothetical protein
MKQIKILWWLFAAALWFFFLSSQTHAYSIGLKSRDNSTQNIKRVEENAGIQVPLVSFIFDPRDTNAYQTLVDIPYSLWRQRIYHITLSPGKYTAQDVADGKADDMYKDFFALLKSLRLKVVFRTMHEMNGGRYPRSSNPRAFSQARKHVREISRAAWLTKEDILFDMSVNGRDMPTRDVIPHQWSSLTYCYPWEKNKIKCPTFEDYYPGDDYVDVMWCTFYNRWKGNTNRQRQAPIDIINHPQRKTLSRLQAIWKPIFVDEVGTTSIRYDGHYEAQKTIDTFGAPDAIKRKNLRLRSLQSFLSTQPSIIGAVYFNVDLTYGLTNRQVGEADRSIFDPATEMMYSWGKDLFAHAKDNQALTSPLLDVFGIRRQSRGTGTVFVSKIYGRNALQLLKSISVSRNTPIITAQTLIKNYEKKVLVPTLSRTQKRRMQRLIQEMYSIVEG